MAKFEILRLSNVRTEAGILSVAAKRGQFVQIKAAGDTNAVADAVLALELADGTQPDAGCLTRNVVADGPPLADHVFPGRLELDFTVGHEVSAEKADKLEAEGDDYLTANITNALTIGTQLSLTGGKLDTVAAGQLPLFQLLAYLTPEEEGKIRILVERNTGTVKAA